MRNCNSAKRSCLVVCCLGIVVEIRRFHSEPFNKVQPAPDYDLPSSLQSRSHFSSFIFLQTSVVCPVFESITVVTGRQLQVTVLAFSCLTTTQCSMSSAMGGGSWLLIGGGVAATGCFFPAQPASSRQNTSQAFPMPFCFRSLVPACRWQSWLHAPTLRRPAAN